MYMYLPTTYVYHVTHTHTPFTPVEVKRLYNTALTGEIQKSQSHP